MSNLAIYARKSTESEDRQVLSIDSQIQELKEFAVRQGLGIPVVLTESKSAKSPGRPIFNDLLARINKGELDSVLCWKIDRLARNPVDGGALIWAMEERKLHTIYTPQTTFRNSGNDKFWMQMEFGMAKKYVDDLSENVKRGLRAKIAQGWLPCVPPLGYLNDRELKRIIKDPVRFPLVRQMWDLLLSGNYTPHAIARIASDKWGLTTRRFKKIGGGPVAYSAVYKIFCNPFYYGTIIYNGQSYNGAHAPMIAFDEFEYAQELLGRRIKPRPQSQSFAYTGLIACGECGAMVTAENKIQRHGHRYTYYHCSKRKRSVRCSQRVIELKQLEEQIVGFLESLTISKEIRDWAFNVLADLDRYDQVTLDAQIKSMNNKVDSITRQLDELLNLKLRELLTDEDYTRKREELRDEQSRLKDKLQKGPHGRCISAPAVFDLAFRAASAFKKGGPRTRRSILHDVGSNLTLKDKILSIKAHKPFEVVRSAVAACPHQIHGFEPGVSGEHKAKDGCQSHDFVDWWGVVSEVRTLCQQNHYEFTFSSLPWRRTGDNLINKKQG